jgi:hypothetical protein
MPNDRAGVCMEATAKGLLAPCIQMKDIWLRQKKQKQSNHKRSSCY